MNGQHFRAILWLRWRLQVNQIKRSGTLNAIIMGLIAASAIFLAFLLFIILFLVGLFALPEASSKVLLYIWDGLVVGFLFSWTLGLLAELQRAEALSLEKLLHLPVSLTGAFLINYLSSLVCGTMILFVPAMVGLTLGLTLSRGPALLLVFPPLVAFLLMVTAITYQFQSWLGALMVNKRRRRTVIVFVTMALILLCQVPNLLNLFRPWGKQPQDELTALQVEEQTEIRQAITAAGRDGQRQLQQLAEIRSKYEQKRSEYQARAKESDQHSLEQVESMANLVNVVLPPGWLPLGVRGAAEGNVLPALLGTLGMTLIGSASLWRSYRTILRLYTGQFTSEKRPPAAISSPVALPVPTAGSPPRLLERQLPWLSEQASAIALSMFRALTRAPEVKMVLLSPIIMVVIFGGVLLRQPVNLPDAVRPLLAFGAMGMILLTLVQLVGNQFGFDRNGFRVFVLCAAPRREILLGKNLAVAPLALGLGTLAIAVLQIVYPMRLTFFLAVWPQLVSMYLLFCMVANWMSIFVPTTIASGSLRPKNVKGVALLLHFFFVLFFPLALSPTLLPLGIQVLLDEMGWSHGVPICLFLSLAECAAMVYLYRLVLTWQGDLLQARELKILEVVTTKSE